MEHESGPMERYYCSNCLDLFRVLMVTVSPGILGPKAENSKLGPRRIRIFANGRNSDAAPQMTRGRRRSDSGVFEAYLASSRRCSIMVAMSRMIGVWYR